MYAAAKTLNTYNRKCEINNKKKVDRQHHSSF